MIKVTGVGASEERLRRLEHSINYSEVPLPFVAVGSEEAFTTAAPGLGVNAFGGLTVDRSVFRRLLPDDRWLLYAAGFVDPADGNTATLRIQYLTNGGGFISLGSVTQAGAGWVKKTIGPIDAAPALAFGETVPIFVLTAQKSAGANGALAHWCIWSRFLSAKQ